MVIQRTKSRARVVRASSNEEMRLKKIKSSFHDARTRTRRNKPDAGAIRRARDGDNLASTDMARVFRRDAIGRRVRGVRGWDDDACAMCVRNSYG